MTAVGSTNIAVSIIIPVRDGEKFLRPCLLSVLAQKACPTLEVSIFDDGSKDATMAIVEEFRPQFESAGITVTTGGTATSGGVGFAKNGSVRQSSGKFLCFLDADDVMSPHRIAEQYAEALKHPEDTVFIGCNFIRDPVGSTERYTRWAAELSPEDVKLQIYTAFGPTLTAPTWFISRKLYNKVNGFVDTIPKGFPEDLVFFYNAIDVGAELVKINRPLMTYRYHPDCATFGVDERTIWGIRIARLESVLFKEWESDYGSDFTFTIWNAGKQGKQFYKSLSPANQARVAAFCDVDVKKLSKRVYECYDPVQRKVTAKIPIMSHLDAIPPVIVCVKLDLTDGGLEANLAAKSWTQGRDYVHFS
uniref:Glyco_trans_2-like domain-containing protein n=1 Tax=Panagrellus redivivus TaxID=6233 RepID=A0A7E4V0R5_PANRE